MLMQLFTVVVCWTLAAIFAAALRHKVSAWTRFKASFAAYRIVPEAVLTPAVALVCVAEAITIVLLLVLAPSGLLCASVLLAAYGVAIVVNVMRGRRHIDCGCGDEPTPVSWILVGRNGLLVMLAGFAFTAGAVPLNWATGLVALGMALLAFGLYHGIEQLLANRGRHQRLWLGA